MDGRGSFTLKAFEEIVHPAVPDLNAEEWLAGRDPMIVYWSGGQLTTLRAPAIALASGREYLDGLEVVCEDKFVVVEISGTEQSCGRPFRGE